MPLEAAKVLLAWLRAMLFDQLLHLMHSRFIPSDLGELHVGRVESSLKLLLFGGEFVGEGFDFVALALGFVALSVGLLGVFLGGGGVGGRFLFASDRFLFIRNGFLLIG